jgi:hypothetical protein
MISLGLSLVILGCTSPARELEPPPRQTSATDTGTAASTSSAPPQSADAQPNDAASAGSTDPVERRRPDIDPVVLTAVRTGRQERFDRIVFEFSGQTLPGYRVAYVSGLVVQCGSGEAIAVAGINTLQVVLTPAQAHTDAGKPTVTPRRWQPGFPTFHPI